MLVVIEKKIIKFNQILINNNQIIFNNIMSNKYIINR
jgi:hypothetical protein